MWYIYTNSFNRLRAVFSNVVYYDGRNPFDPTRYADR